MMAEELGAKVHGAADGLEGVLRVEQSGPYDLVLVDYEMPGQDGAATIQQIRAVEARRGLDRQRLVGLSADTSGTAADLLLAAGANSHLRKPLSAAVLERELSRWRPADTSASADGERPPAVVDWRAASARTGLPSRVLLSVAETFEPEVGMRLEEGQAAADEGDLAKLRSVAHALRGSAAVFVAERTVQATQDVSRACQAGDDLAARAAWAKLKHEVRALIAGLAEIRNSPDAPPEGSGS